MDARAVGDAAVSPYWPGQRAVEARRGTGEKEGKGLVLVALSLLALLKKYRATSNIFVPKTSACGFYCSGGGGGR